MTEAAMEMEADEETAGLFTRGVLDEIILREVNEKSRSATFVAATENGVMTYYGREYLKMAGARLARFRKNPVVLDAHNRYEAGAVIGRADVKIEEKKLTATVTFAETARAEEIWQLVKGKFLRALSVGFIPDEARTVRLAAGETDGEGDGIIEGPARIVKSWELFEISVVPVPADADALRRAIRTGDQELVEHLTQLIKRIEKGAERETKMSDEHKEQPTNAPELKGAEQRETTPVNSTDASEVERRARDIRALTPKSLGERGVQLADEFIAQNVTVGDASKRFLEELQKAAPAVGTPEPETAKREGGEKGASKLSEMDNDAFKRALIG